MRVATDVGGTFTDLVVFDRDGVRHVKTDTTPPDFERGVLNAISKADLDPATFQFFAHGTTVVINALISRRGAKTALITTRGFRDVLEIARGNRPDLFNFAFDKPTPFVPRHLRREVTERVSYKGEVLTALAIGEVDEIVRELKSENVESIAVCFLHAYVNSNHEELVANRLRELWPEIEVITSHEVCREWREYERTSTTVTSAYVLPSAKKYLNGLEEKLREQKLPQAPYIMQSNGGIATVRAAAGNPISMVESGPASGVLGAIALGEKISEPNIIALDIGGTTAKCALIHNGRAKITTEYYIEWSKTNPGYPIRTPVVEIVEIGNGGGSIAWVDEGDRLHVGPQSAGSLPGPAAYGRGGEDVTTTDANLVLGRINPDLFLGGEQKPDNEAIDKAFNILSTKLSASKEDLARGVVRIANANMVNALKLISLNKGYDPRDFTLVAFGGGGAMHAVDLAEELMVKKVVIPANSSVFSAWGMLMTDLRRDFLQTHVTSMDGDSLSEIKRGYEELAQESLSVCLSEGMPKENIKIERFADARYRGQEHTVKIPFPDGEINRNVIQRAIEEFHVSHEREYSFQLENSVEIVNFHIVVKATIEKQEIPSAALTGRTLDQARRNSRNVDFDAHGVHEASIFDWRLLEPGMYFEGPAVVEDPTTTLVVSPGKSVRMDEFGNLHVEWN